MKLGFCATSVVRLIAGLGLIGLAGQALAQDPSELVIDSVTAQQGQELTIPVTLTENNHDVDSLAVDIIYDFNNLTLRPGGDADNAGITGCTFVDKGPANPDKIISCSEPVGTDDTLRVIVDNSGDDFGPLNEDIIFFIRIDVDADAPFDDYTLQLDWFEANGGAIDVADLNGVDGVITVVDASSVLNVQPPSHDFQGVEAGSSSTPLEVTISNDGTDDIDLNVSDVVLDDTTNFSLDVSGGSAPCGGTTFTLADNESCTVSVTFTPQSEAAFTASLQVASDAGQVTNDTVQLEGQGTPGPAGDITLSADHGFGDLLVNQESAQHTFTATNATGGDGSAVDVDTVALSGDTAHFEIVSEDCTGSLASGASCSVTVEFAPTAEGDFTVTLTVSGEDGNGDPQSDTAQATGSGVSEPRFSANPAPGTVSLGSIQPGGTLSQDVTITNQGNENLNATCGSLNDPDGVFSLNPDPADFFDIEPGTSESFTVSCTLPDVASYEATMQCQTNEEGTPTYDYTFRCTGQPLIIPTMQTWGLMLFALMMLIIGGFSIRFFRVG